MGSRNDAKSHQYPSGKLHVVPKGVNVQTDRIPFVCSIGSTRGSGGGRRVRQPSDKRRNAVRNTSYLFGRIACLVGGGRRRIWPRSSAAADQPRHLFDRGSFAVGNSLCYSSALRIETLRKGAMIIERTSA